MVLVVEDDDDIRGVLCDVLLDEGYLVREALSLAQARAHFQSGRPDAMLLDFQLGDGTGDELLNELVLRDAGTPTVMVSASPRARTVAHEFGISVVTKPFDVDCLLETLLRAIEKGSSPSRA
ncbi:MAG: hypothetical protein NVS3B20_10390 [Polyangiales bacterium]